MEEIGANTPMEEVFGDIGMEDPAFYITLDASLNPRSPFVLFDIADRLLGDNKGEKHILDAGCREGLHAVELAERFVCRVTGIDVVEYAIQEARQFVTERSLSDSVNFLVADVQKLEFPESEFDLVWCRDMLCHVPDIEKAFSECRRVLKPEGSILVYNTFATPLLEPNEATRLYTPLAVVPANMSHEYFEDAISSSGLKIAECQEIGSEWKEYIEEQAHRYTSKQLLRIAHMIRGRDELLKKVGKQAYEVELAQCHWAVYQMLGKLTSRIYVLVK